MSNSHYTAWLSQVNKALVKSRINKDTNCTFTSVAVPYKDSADGFLRITVSESQISSCACKKGVRSEDYVNVLLGEPYYIRRASVRTTSGGYKNIYLTNEKVAEIYNASRDEYRRAKSCA